MNTDTKTKASILMTEVEFKSIVEKHAPNILYIIQVEFGIKDLYTFDVVQDILVKYWKAVEAGAINSYPVAYLMQITRHVCIDYKKKREKRLTVSLDEISFSDCSNSLSQEPEILEKFEQEQQITLQTIRDLVPYIERKKNREIFKKVFFDGKTYTELSKEYNMKANSINKIYLRARDKIRNLLGK